MRVLLTRTSVVAALVALYCLGTAGASAASVRLDSFDLKQRFVECGYDVSNPSIPTRTIAIYDRGVALGDGSDYRVAMAIVYPDVTAALGAHRDAHLAAEQMLGTTWQVSDNQGPQLLAGYGASVWRDNVALVQSSARRLADMYAYDLQSEETRLARPDLMQLGFVSSRAEYGVDRDFVVCLDQAVALLSGPQ